MGKSDAAVGNWLSDKERFADLFNAELFGGEEMIKPEELERLPGESVIQFPDKNKDTKTVKRYRDIVMRWKKEVTLAILALENQDKINYLMPVRNMTYDGITYTDQAQALWKERRKEIKEITKDESAAVKETLSFAEYMSRFRKTDKLYPVITLVFYYGEEPWDASFDLYGLFPEELYKDYREVLERYVPNYWINLIDVYRMKNTPFQKTDLQIILQMLKYKKEKNQMKQYITDHSDFFKKVDYETYEAIHALLHSKNKIKEIQPEEEEGGVNMCEAFEEYYKDGVKKGVKEGIKKGEKKGVKKGIKKGEKKVNQLFSKLFALERYEDAKKSTEDSEYQQKLFEEFGL